MEGILSETADRMKNNYPYFHPLFAGQMLKPPHPIARMAYMLAMWINPNNHALDGGRASSAMEKEVVAELAQMFGWERHLGHLTGGGTLANLEGLWIAGQTRPGKMVAASDMAHYTHERITGTLKIGFSKIATDRTGRMDMNDLEKKLKKGAIGTVVCTMGTTGTGSVDPLDEILEFQKKYDFRIHADAAYGGYFILLDNMASSTAEKYELLHLVDSIVIDPHKHGLQPYGCGCILFKDPETAKYYQHDSPYTYYTSDDLHLGEISLECSRAGASAAGLWATHQLLPLVKGGDFSRSLGKSREAALKLYNKLAETPHFHTIMKPETDIVIWAMQGGRISEMNNKAEQFFRNAERNSLYLSLYNYPTDKLPSDQFQIDCSYLTCLRSCLMKPEHELWIDEIWRLLMLSLG